VTEPIWLDRDVVMKIHIRCAVASGGSSGVRDYGLLDSALARPQMVYDYKLDATIHGLAAAYAYGISKNHPFVDGNKRVAFLSAENFLWVNGWQLTASQSDVVTTMIALAAGDISEDQLAEWLAQNSERRPPEN
jgi:death-on-curing protein